MKKIFFLMMLGLCIVNNILCEDVLFYAPSTVFQGDPFSVSIISESFPLHLKAHLINQNGKVLQTAESFVFLVYGKYVVNTVIFGVASMWATGDLSIEFFNKEDSTISYKTITITILEKKFNTTIINLTKELSTLITAPDPEKTKQSEILSSILYTQNRESIFWWSKFIWPVQDIKKKSSLFGDIRKYIYANKTSSNSYHYGLDFSLSPNTQVFAPGEGKVLFAELRIITGNTVIIEHLPGMYSLYYHLNSIDIKKDDFVKIGTPIGKVGSTGFSTGSHLHWEIRINGSAVSPEYFITNSLIDKDAILSTISVLKGR